MVRANNNMNFLWATEVSAVINQGQAFVLLSLFLSSPLCALLQLLFFPSVCLNCDFLLSAFHNSISICWKQICFSMKLR